ncbi:MAG: hypothetical protein OXU20_19615 [Myxococcales bacterium]|nr:hypothetical protein [Myxococcales bacterium]MDD9965853.1 hypothetical protein [Myxococcales bacterium]
MVRVTAALCVLGSVLGTGSTVSAQACCGANSTTDFGVVAPWMRATAASSLSYRQGFGSFDTAGRFVAGGDFTDRDVALRIGGGIRLWYQPLQIHGSVPVRIQHRQIGDESATRAGFGDITAALRWTASQPSVDGISLEDPSTFVPLCDLFVGGKAPTGAEPGKDMHPTQADVFGNGAWEASVGTRIAKSLTTRHLVALRLQYDVRFETERDQLDDTTAGFKPGNQLNLRFEYLYTDSIFWTGGLFANLRVAGQSQQDGSAIPDTDERLLNFGIQVIHALAYPQWDLIVAASSDAFWDQGGVGVPFASFGLSVAVRRTFLDGDGHGGSDHHGHHGDDGHHEHHGH